MAEDDSAMTSAKDALSSRAIRRKKQGLEGNARVEEDQALEGIFSLYPADIQSTTGSGATPIGSAGRAPDRNKKEDSKNLVNRTRARGLEFEKGNVVLQQQLTGSYNGTGLVTRSLVQKMRSRRFFQKKNFRHKDEEENFGMKMKKLST